MSDLPEISFIVSGLSGCHGIFRETFSSFREALQCYVSHKYCDYADVGDISMSVRFLDRNFTAVICCLPSVDKVLSGIFIDSLDELNRGCSDEGVETDD